MFTRAIAIALIVSGLTACGSGGDAALSTNSNQAQQASEPPHAGKAVYDKYCKACHAPGLNGAPILGNKAMWGPRLSKGEAALVENAKNGVGLMPANLGRKPELDEEAIASVVNYMLSQIE